MTATATRSTRGLPREQAPEAWTSKAPELHVAWALSSPARERLDVSVRYRKLNTLTVGEFRIE